MSGLGIGACGTRSVRALAAWLGCAVVVFGGVATVFAPPASGASPPLGPADASPPVGVIEYPLADSWVNCRWVGILVHFADPDGIDASSLAIEVDGTPFPTDWNPNSGGTDGDLYVYGGPFAEGPHRAEARASDRLGNGPTNLSWSFSIDTIPPVVNVTYPQGNPLVPGGSLDFTWTGSDTGSGIDYYWIRVDDGPSINVGRVTSFPFHDLAPGIHYFTVGAFDVAGNYDSYPYSSGVYGVATVPRPATPPANPSTQVFVTVPEGMPSWAVALLALNAVEAAAVAWLASRKRTTPGGDTQHA